MTFKVTTGGKSMTMGDKMAALFVTEGMADKISGNVNIEYVGPDVHPDMSDDYIPLWEAIRKTKKDPNPPNSILRERG